LATTKGEVLINKAFIGTTSYNQLKTTLRHDIARLAVGIDHHHDNIFKVCLTVFDGYISIPEHEIKAIASYISFKWQVYIKFGRW